MPKKFAVVILVVLGSLASAAIALAGGSISSVSKSGIVQPGTVKTVTPNCKHGQRSISAGFDGVLSGSPSMPSDLKLTFATKLRLDRGNAKAGFVNPSGKDVRVRGIAYCGEPRVSEATKKMTVASGGVRTVTAKCPHGRSAMSGGFSSALDLPNESGALTTSSYRSARGKWSSVFVSAGSGPSQASTYAYCASEKALKVRAKKVTLQPLAATGEPRAIDARCKKGERVVSGGFRTAQSSTQNGPIVVDSLRKSPGTWRVVAATSSTPVKFTVDAYCRKK